MEDERIEQPPENISELSKKKGNPKFFFSKKVGFILLGLLLTGGLIFKVYSKNHFSHSSKRSDLLTASPTPPPDPLVVNSHWKTYKNNQMGFELKYPNQFFDLLVTDENNDHVTFGFPQPSNSQYYKDRSPLFIITTGDYTNPRTMSVCQINKQNIITNYPCLSGMTYLRTKDMSETTLGNRSAETFYFSDSQDTYKITQTKQSPFIQIKSFPLSYLEIGDKVMDQILTTFKFTK